MGWVKKFAICTVYLLHSIYKPNAPKKCLQVASNIYIIPHSNFSILNDMTKVLVAII